jgi:DNA gyrase inhibitor GyrI
MIMEMIARRLMPMPVVSVAAVGPYEETTVEAWAHLRVLLTKHGVRELCTPVFALLRDLPQEVPADKRRLELCAFVDDSARRRLEGEATIQTFAGGNYLMANHRGNYQGLPQVFGRMYAACSLDMNVTIDSKRPRVVIFSGDPATSRPEELGAQIGVPVASLPPDRPKNSA